MKTIIRISTSIILYHLYYRWIFLSIGKCVRIFSLLKLNGSRNIKIGNNVTIEYKTWLAAMPLTGFKTCLLEINNNTSIGHYNHIFATKRIYIGKNVLTADGVYISDNTHSYDDINIPIIDQPILQKKEVEIGDGTWIGENACVIGVKIGKNCVIGANSVVTKDIPDYSVVAGNPARIIKKYDFDSSTWEKFSERGVVC